ncbi:Vps51p LALA0_S10e03928g [Lachancea lanzarotensis]|uniref:LALA0S10e03928g1_1 n=1 Tax=Lachancea lanzarotensis TaxID=1245769 RepID=A0A0C7NEP8_9SACH|nr:uncharacterized protein LALA0_S10e03928g [Lachancea lanzarotensis]CEP64166.1 LALA0S10e03928g1_1 [Lachancea lanzarotensis]
MAEQITHKRPLRIKVDKERRKQLHDFYKLKETAEAGSEVDAKDESEVETDSIDTETTDQHGVRLPKVSEARLAQLVHAHNELSSQKAAMNNTVKNTIYENYYDLIKVNELLHSVSVGENEHLEKLKQVLKMLEG